MFTINNVKEVTQTPETNAVNDLLEKGWVLLATYTSVVGVGNNSNDQELYYVLGRVE